MFCVTHVLYVTGSQQRVHLDAGVMHSSIKLNWRDHSYLQTAIGALYISKLSTMSDLTSKPLTHGTSPALIQSSASRLMACVA